MVGPYFGRNLRFSDFSSESSVSRVWGTYTTFGPISDYFDRFRQFWTRFGPILDLQNSEKRPKSAYASLGVPGFGPEIDQKGVQVCS